MFASTQPCLVPPAVPGASAGVGVGNGQEMGLWDERLDLTPAPLGMKMSSILAGVTSWGGAAQAIQLGSPCPFSRNYPLHGPEVCRGKEKKRIYVVETSPQSHLKPRGCEQGTANRWLTSAGWVGLGTYQGETAGHLRGSEPSLRDRSLWGIVASRRGWGTGRSSSHLLFPDHTSVMRSPPTSLPGISCCCRSK